MKAQKIGGWPRGLCNRTDGHLLPKDGLRVADNVDVSLDGSIKRRDAYPSSLSTQRSHSLIEHNGQVFGVVGNALGRIDDSGFTHLADMPGKVAWCVVNGSLVGTTTMGNFRVKPTGIEWLGVNAPAGMAVLASPTGGMACAGRYGVSVAYVNAAGEEGGGTHPVFVDIEAGGGIQLSVPPDDEAVAVRTYRTQANGDVFYLSETFPLFGAAVQATLGEITLGDPANAIGYARMPGGHAACYWRGRLLVLRGNALLFSEPLRYGLMHPATGKIHFESRPAWVVPVDGGLFVGLKAGVVFLRGSSPDDLVRVDVDEPPHLGGATVIDGARTGLDGVTSLGMIAVWFGRRGFALGLPSGEVLHPQAAHVDGLELGNGRVVFHDGRLVVLFD